MNINDIQEFFKCLNPLLMIPYTRNINRNHPITLKNCKRHIMLNSFNRMILTATMSSETWNLKIMDNYRLWLIFWKPQQTGLGTRLRSICFFLFLPWIYLYIYVRLVVDWLNWLNQLAFHLTNRLRFKKLVMKTGKDNQ